MLLRGRRSALVHLQAGATAHRQEPLRLNDQELQYQEAGVHRQHLQQDPPPPVQSQDLLRHLNLPQDQIQRQEAGKNIEDNINKGHTETCPFFVKFGAGDNFIK